MHQSHVLQKSLLHQREIVAFLSSDSYLLMDLCNLLLWIARLLVLLVVERAAADTDLP